MIQKIPNPIILCHLLKIYNLKRSPTSKRIYSELLSNFLGRLLGFEGVDIIGLFRNALDKNVQNTKQYRVLCERVIQ